MSELGAAPHRSWFVTLTVRGSDRFLAKAQASVEARRRGIADLESEDDRTITRYLANVMGEWLTRYLKRVRRDRKDDAGPVKFRYLVAAEAHRDGFPHFHLLIHEGLGSRIPWRRLQRWNHGHVHAKLVNDELKSARYLAKYCAKSLLTRVRASRYYGRSLELALALDTTRLTFLKKGAVGLGRETSPPPARNKFRSERRTEP